MVKLWTVNRTDAIEYDQYSMFVVAAPTAELARRQSPDHFDHWDEARRVFVDNDDGEPVRYTSWTNDIDSLTVTEIGTAVDGTVTGTVLCASFNAG